MPLNRSVTMVISDYLNNERPDDEKVDEESRDALFLSLQGKRMTERAIRDMCKKYTSIGMETSRKAGYSPHKLRATAATSLIGRGNSELCQPAGIRKKTQISVRCKIRQTQP